MEFNISSITIKELIALNEKDQLDLSPPYQRNEIWSTNSKKTLIDSIIRNYPLPNFFVRIKENGIWEMVDGQQRTRAIIGFYKRLYPTIDKEFYDNKLFPDFLNYKIAVIFIERLKNNESIEEFYVRVNSTGLKLNRPELKKAEYYNTRFLNLVQELSSNDKFVDLDLFTESSLNRMNDVEFVSELVAQLIYGIYEKKDAVDRLFKDDIDEKQYNNIKITFLNLINIIDKLNEIYAVKKTRYRQRNDFYTLFGFLNKIKNISMDTIKYFYKTLVLIGDDISPSNEDCEPFEEYALNCVSQSNSKAAREKRLKFYVELFLNSSKTVNNTQEQIMKYYEIKKTIRLDGYILIDNIELQNAVGQPIILSR